MGTRSKRIPLTMADMAPIRVPPNLPSLVKAAFTRAKAAGVLTYYPTQVAVLKPNSIPFQLRFSPSLASKPNAAPKPKDPNVKPFDPFEDPLPSMTVAELAPTHILVLNKFAIIPEHFILATKAFRPQTHVLEAADVGAAYACVAAYLEEKRDLFVFFNSGEHSGASQSHRHLQLLPVESLRGELEGVEAGAEWDVLAKTVNGQQEKLPFTVLTQEIAPGARLEELHSAYLGLYRRAVALVLPDEEEPSASIGEARISYNFAMTATVMALCPRLAEGTAIKNKAGEEVGYMALNGTVLAGTALVKNAAEWDALREDPDILLEVLRRIGVPLPPPTEDLSACL